MNREAIHENLSTSFVDLEALVRHLTGLQFAGVVHLELSSYEADMTFSPGVPIEVREYDHLSGRMRRDPEVLQRIFERAREPLGRISVYRFVPRSANIRVSGIYVDPAILGRARSSASGRGDTPATHLVTLIPATESPDLASVISDLIETVDASLQISGLDFRQAFQNTCAALASNYPFLAPGAGAVSFTGGTVKVQICVSTREFTKGLSEVLGQLFSRLAELSGQRAALAALRDDVEIFSRRRWAELERLGLRRFPASLFENV